MDAEMTDKPVFTEAPPPTQEELNAEARAWGFLDWETFSRYYDDEMKRLGTEGEK